MHVVFQNFGHHNLFSLTDFTFFHSFVHFFYFNSWFYRFYFYCFFHRSYRFYLFPLFNRSYRCLSLTDATDSISIFNLYILQIYSIVLNTPLLIHSRKLYHPGFFNITQLTHIIQHWNIHFFETGLKMILTINTATLFGNITVCTSCIVYLQLCCYAPFKPYILLKNFQN